MLVLSTVAQGLVRSACGLLLAVFSGGVAAAAVEPPRLALPVVCSVGVDCWPVVYFDRLASTDAADYRCGRLSYDGHTGTDFAVADMAAVARGVPVVASAPGVVGNVRDGMPDVDVTTIDRDSLQERDCGNGVAVSHDGAWETLYCHLREGSIAVEPGDAVATGDLLGFVGMSGNASFPHVELTVQRDDERVDPFTGSSEPAAGSACDLGPGPMWTAEALAATTYAPVVVTKLGLAGEVPTWDAVKEGRHAGTTLAANAPAFVVFVEGYALAAGDRLELVVTDPTGDEFHRHVFVEDRAQARFFRFTGRRATVDGFAAGVYEVSLAWSDGDGLLLAGRRAEMRID